MNCYKFQSRKQFLTLAAAEGLIATDDDGNETLITGGHGFAIDEVGTIYEGGTFNEQGEIVTPFVVLDGWHVNTVGFNPETWQEYKLNPKTPVRVFL
jgi:hypothetical protein